METEAFFRASKILLVAGKGGVGKTTGAAALAWSAAAVGLRVVLVEVDGTRGIASRFDAPALAYEPSELHARTTGSLYGRRITPDDALLEYLADHGMKRLGGRLVSTGTLDVIATAAPGIKDILILGKLKQLVGTDAADLLVLDTPASGHALSFLRSPKGLADTVRSGPIRRQADEVVAVLTDPALCQVVLVTLAEETPVSEVMETAYALEEEVGVALGPVIVNALLAPVPDDPPGRFAATLVTREADALTAALSFERTRVDAQSHQRDRLRRELPLAQIALPLLPVRHIGPTEIETLSTHLVNGIRHLADRA